MVLCQLLARQLDRMIISSGIPVVITLAWLRLQLRQRLE